MLRLPIIAPSPTITGAAWGGSSTPPIPTPLTTLWIAKTRLLRQSDAHDAAITACITAPISRGLAAPVAAIADCTIWRSSSSDSSAGR